MGDFDAEVASLTGDVSTSRPTGGTIVQIGDEYSVSWNQPLNQQMTGQDTEAVVLATNSRSATRAAAASHPHQHHKLSAQPSDDSGDDDAMEVVPAAASAPTGASPPSPSEVSEHHLRNAGAGKVTAMDSEDSDREPKPI